MVEKLYWLDSYVKEFSANIVAVEGNEVFLDKTAFYPVGGGQPCDTGTILSNDRIYNVVEVKKRENNIVHIVNNADGIKIGECTCMIDWERRYAHMRYHTALHIIDGVVFKQYNGDITGGQIYEDKARMDFNIKDLDREKVQHIIDDSQKVVDDGLRVFPKIISKEEAAAIPNLSRTGPGTDLLAKLEDVRVIEIEGFDMQLDGGTHVANTKEVGKIVLDKYENKGSTNKRITIKLE